MSAQQQLAELLQIKRDYIDPLGPAAKTKPAFDKPCADFIRDHGPAIAELIAEVAEQKAWFDRIVEHRQAGGDVPHAMLDRSAQSRKRMHEIIEKLTTEPPSAN